MKASLTDYASALAAEDPAIIEELIGKKYRKFIRFFALLRDYTDDIVKLKYELSGKDSLSVQITFTKEVSLSEKKELIDEMRENGYEVEEKKNKKKMKLSITHVEEN